MEGDLGQEMPPKFQMGYWVASLMAVTYDSRQPNFAAPHHHVLL